MMATSEIRRRDRRGVTPGHILYLAMKILRLRILRIVDGIHNAFRYIRATENFTRKQIEDRTFVEECVEKNFVLLIALPNSFAYWQIRRNHRSVMIRRLTMRYRQQSSVAVTGLLQTGQSVRQSDGKFSSIITNNGNSEALLTMTNRLP